MRKRLRKFSKLPKSVYGLHCRLRAERRHFLAQFFDDGRVAAFLAQPGNLFPFVRQLPAHLIEARGGSVPAAGQRAERNQAGAEGRGGRFQLRGRQVAGGHFLPQVFGEQLSLAVDHPDGEDQHDEPAAPIQEGADRQSAPSAYQGGEGVVEGVGEHGHGQSRERGEKFGEAVPAQAGDGKADAGESRVERVLPANQDDAHEDEKPETSPARF